MIYFILTLVLIGNIIKYMSDELKYREFLESNKCGTEELIRQTIADYEDEKYRPIRPIIRTLIIILLYNLFLKIYS